MCLGVCILNEFTEIKVKTISEIEWEEKKKYINGQELVPRRGTRPGGRGTLTDGRGTLIGGWGTLTEGRGIRAEIFLKRGNGIPPK